MRMKKQVLPPRMEDAEEPDIGAKVLRVVGNFDHGLCANSK
jgi:hypothetical protein